MPDNRPTVQVNQPDIINTPETNWPSPLVDPSSQLKVKVTHGSNGSQEMRTIMATAGQDQLSRPEGAVKIDKGDYLEQGGHGNKFKTSQMNSPDPISNAEAGDNQ
jgi:hypothetical protein